MLAPSHRSMQDPNEIAVSATEILPGLWLGNQASSQSSLVDRVDVVVNCTKHIPFLNRADKVKIRIPINDPGAPTYDWAEAKLLDKDQKIMLISLPVLMPILSKLRKLNKKILIHCHAGAQRSAAIVAAYIMQYGLWNVPREYKHLDSKKLRLMKLITVVNMIVKKRPVAFYGGRSINFAPALLHHFDI